MSGKSGKLYVIGVGPGDPELLTLKAARIIRESRVICVPKGREEGSSLALSIAEKAVSLDGKEIIEAYFPMRKTRSSGEAGKRGSGEELDAQWNKTAGMISGKLHESKDVAFLTLGDPTIYSTFYYLYDKLVELSPAVNIEIIPGVSSINASAARAKMALGLGDDRIAILPANYPGDLRTVLETFDTVVLMKVHKVFDKVTGLLREMRLLDKAVYIAQAGMEDERIFSDIRDVGGEDLRYFSMVIVKK